MHQPSPECKVANKHTVQGYYRPQPEKIYPGLGKSQSTPKEAIISQKMTSAVLLANVMKPMNLSLEEAEETYGAVTSGISRGLR
jgi:hypothetical protein